MSNVVYSLLISGIAGLATLLGTVVIFLNFKNVNKIICYSLSFAAGIMITISLIDLVPLSFGYINSLFDIIPTLLVLLLFIVIGILITMLIDKLIPEDNSTYNSQLFRTGIFSMIVLLIHNIPEGIATFITSMSDLSFGISLALAISLHNIPEGIGIAVPIYYATGNRFKALSYTFIAGISEFLGALIAYKFLSPFMSDAIFAFLFATIAGMMIYISYNELIPKALKYGDILKVVMFFFLAILVMVFCHLLLH